MCDKTKVCCSEDLRLIITELRTQEAELRAENRTLREELLLAVVYTCNDYHSKGNFDRLVKTGLIDLGEYEEKIAQEEGL